MPESELDLSDFEPDYKKAYNDLRMTAQLVLAYRHDLTHPQLERHLDELDCLANRSL